MLSKFYIPTAVSATAFSYHGYTGPKVNDDCSNFNDQQGCTSGD